jgi:predicted CoA-binding protein
MVDECFIPRTSDMPDDAVAVQILARATSVAVVGASPNPLRTSHAISLWLMENTPLQVFLVNPAADGEIDGHAFYRSLADLPVTPDIVNVFRRAEFADEVVDQAIGADATTVWLQLGVVNDEAIAKARAAGLNAVQNRCIKIEYLRLRDRIEAARALQA